MLEWLGESVIVVVVVIFVFTAHLSVWFVDIFMILCHLCFHSQGIILILSAVLNADMEIGNGTLCYGFHSTVSVIVPTTLKLTKLQSQRKNDSIPWGLNAEASVALCCSLSKEREVYCL